MAADGKTVQAQGTAAPPPTPLKMRLIDRVVDKMQKDTGALKEILLCEMKLTDDDMALLATEVKKTGSVCSLSLFGSQISEKAAESLASALASHKSLTMLDLGRNKLNTSGVEAVCNALIRNSSLKTLGLAGNAMGNQGATAVAHVLRVNRSLTEVYLNSNDIEAEGASELAGALSFNDHSRLSRLYVHSNPLGPEGVEELGKFLQDCPKALDRVPLNEEKALVLAMGTHTRLAKRDENKNASCIYMLAEEDTPPAESKYAKNRSTRQELLLQIVRECWVDREVDRQIIGL